MKPGPKLKPDNLKKAKQRNVRLSHSTEKKLSRAVSIKAAKNVTDGIEKAVDNWEI